MKQVVCANFYVHSGRNDLMILWRCLHALLQ